jgi:hypothetical protein
MYDAASAYTLFNSVATETAVWRQVGIRTNHVYCSLRYHMTFAFDSIAQTIKPIPYQTQQRCYGSNLPAGESDSYPAESCHIEVHYGRDSHPAPPCPKTTK